MDFVKSKFGPKPSVIVNIAKYQDSEVFDSIYGITNMRNFMLVYSVDRNISRLFLVNDSDKEKMKKYGYAFWPIHGICANCTTYSFTIKNIGTKKVDIITMSIDSGFLTPELVLNSPKIKKDYCGSIFINNQGCELILEDLDMDEQVSFELLINGTTDINIESCVVNEKYQCEINFFTIWQQTIIEPDKYILYIDGVKTKFPKLVENETSKFFWLNKSYFEARKKI